MNMREWLRERGVWWHSQNLNENRRGEIKGSAVRHGRAWLTWWEGRGSNAEQQRLSLDAEWVLGRLDSLGLSVELQRGGEDQVQLSIGFVLGHLYLGVGHLLPRQYLPSRAREISVSLDLRGGDGIADVPALRWHVWQDPWEWRASDPAWRRGHINFWDVVAGRAVYSNRVLETERVVLPLPEGSIPGSVQLEESTWSWPRWPFVRRGTYARVKPDQGAWVPGKGENSWDCGDDAILELSCQANTVEEAIGIFVGRVLATRRQRGSRQSVYGQVADASS